MKKVFSGIFLLSVFIYACDKEIQTTPLTLDMAQKGVIKGYVYADLDQTKYDLEMAPAGTKISFTVRLEDFGLNTNGVYQDSVRLDANGQFQIKVPADNDGVYVNIKPSDFVFDQVQEFNSSKSSIRTLYTSGQQDVQLIAGDVSVVTLVYDYIPLSAKFVTISGKIMGEFDESATGLENVPAGKQITFFCTGWSKTLTTSSDGTYSIDVPYGEEIRYYFSFTASKTVKSGITWVSKTYSYSTPLSGTFWNDFYGNLTNVVINVGSGVLVP